MSTTPRYLISITISIMTLANMIFVVFFGTAPFDIIIAFVLATFKESLEKHNHSKILARSSFNLLIASSISPGFHLMYISVSSAKSLILQCCNISTMSLMNIINKIKLRTEPCGIPIEIGKVFEW